jgi:hypothetical protein
VVAHRLAEEIGADRLAQVLAGMHELSEALERMER